MQGMPTPRVGQVQGVALVILVLTLQCGGVARQGTRDWGPTRRGEIYKNLIQMIIYWPQKTKHHDKQKSFLV